MMTRTSTPSPRKAGGKAPATSARPPTLANGAASAVTKRTRIAFVRSRPAVRALVAILECCTLQAKAGAAADRQQRAFLLGSAWRNGRSKQSPELLRCCGRTAHRARMRSSADEPSGRFLGIYAPGADGRGRRAPD